MTGQQQYSLRWNDYTSYITGAFDALRYEEDLVDVTLFCEGRKIRAHKVLLSACSTYFKEIFKENPSQHPVIIFKNVKYSDLMSLVEFMYQGEVSVLQESLPSFLHTAEMLSIRGLADTNNEQQQQQQHHHLPDQPTSTLAQQILQTQSQNMATSATITTSEPVYFTLPSNSTIVPQTKLEPQPSTATALQTAQQFVNKITLKSSDIANAVAVPIGQQQAQQQHQQQQLAKIQVKPAPAVATAVPQRTVAVGQTQGQDQTNQTNQAATLQELVDSVVTSARPTKPKRTIKAKTLTVKQPVAGTSSGSVSGNTRASYSEITSETGNQSDNGMDLYSEQSGQEHDQVTTYTDSTNNDVKIQISEYINVGEGLNPTSGDSGSYTQQEGYELVGDAIAERQEGDEHMGQNCFEMEIVDMDVNGMFPDDGAEDAKVKTETMDESAGRSRDDGKKFQCKECDKAFATWKSLAMHRHIHSGRTKCKICGAVLSRTANLKRHMKLKHEP
ncbi:protein abrupt-like [Anopheles bellator]|uniref:protein abrupt-like n=1 Tax=Anopheles bellator TaxID=139047 RepID=UPI002649A2CE|nr:protein abrupt-like [Anopheles bellator]